MPKSPDARPDDLSPSALRKRLHDGLAQEVGGIMLSMAVLAATLRKEGSPHAETAEHIARMAESATTSVRDLMADLRE